jgi:hypothetical protein
LLGRVAVTCRTSVEATALNVWRAELVATWPATGGVDAGQWGMDLYLASDGGLSGQAMHPANQTTVFPGTIGELPPPLSGRLELPIGSIVAVLPPGIDQSLPPIQALYQRPDDRVDVGQIVYEAPAGTRLTVVHGPVEHEGIDWYVVDWSHGTEYPSVLGWIPATSGGRPLLEIVDPRCPADAGVTVSQLLRVIPSERVACFGGREIALEVVLATVPPLEAGAPIDGTPDWLAPDTSWRLWGPAGPEGVEGSLPIAAHPSLPGGATASEGIVRVRGHFDDAAAATCERRFPAGWVSIPELPATQVMRCRQLFVVTAIEAPAP